MPAVDSVHEVARAAAGDAGGVYADIDPIVVDLGCRMVRDPPQVLYHPQVLDLIDFGEPVAVLAGLVFGFVGDAAAPARILRRISENLVTGSYLVMSRIGPDPAPPGRLRQQRALELCAQAEMPVTVRSRDQIAGLLPAACDLVAAGVVPVTAWHPDPEDADDLPQWAVLAAVAYTR
ncbi:SAM-dependent methyltransferase [Catenuloplanes nepalensis]|uniref:SAM-dependent methyltransferase n=1 Tax=Catenuloplanes nepalensis TaxID=587533 RepID=UPI003520D798